MLSNQQKKDSPYPEDLAQWLDLDYHRRLRPLRGWRKWATGLACVLATAVVAWSFWPGNRRTQQAGPLSTAHASFQNDCAQCHTQSLTPLARLAHGDSVPAVPNDACKVCHDGGPHYGTLGDCATCHREHLGKPELARVPDGHCTICHSNLSQFHGSGKLENTTASGTDDELGRGKLLPHIRMENVSAFTKQGHPEFRILKTSARDAAQLRFNHAVHLELNLRALKDKGAHGLDRFGSRLECESCHQPDAERRYMKPIQYEDHCAACHPLGVLLVGRFADPKAAAAADVFRRRPAPHDKPEVVRAVMRERFLEFARASPSALDEHAPVEPERPIPGRSLREVTEAELLWVKGQAGPTEERLFANKQQPGVEHWLFDQGANCRHCHVPAGPSHAENGLPLFLRSQVPERWFQHSNFRHDSHRMVGCTECHGQAVTSRETSDVLLPGRDTCLRCHTGSGTGARADCAECHSYHERGKERGLDGPLKIEDFLRRQ
jgi:hypothetical protein